MTTLRPGSVTTVRCARCNEPVSSFAQWFSDPCQMESKEQPGHVLSWPEIMTLLRPEMEVSQP